ncbi:helix-turn-helix domain-containing protein [Parvibaculaceae bacterium PLY_AMNH_Bact1]|nr:helix-turn-helix domain-containing protein [Parvibaculaceae bacterium PLY_AMNH_Bact1]
MRSDEVETIRQLTLFSDLSKDTFDDLMQGAYVQTFPPHLQLITEGDTADFLHVVIEGLVEQFSESNGRETTLKVAGNLSTFILAAVLKDAVYLASARTVQKTKLLLIPAANVREALDDDVEFSRTIVQELAGDYRGLMKALKGQKLRSTTERLANYLLQQRQLQGGQASLILPHGKKTLASLLGMTPENLSRAFGTLRQHQVQMTGREVLINDAEELSALAQPTPLIDDSEI